MEVAQTPLQLTQDHQDGRMTGKKLPFLKKKKILLLVVIF